MKKKFVLVALLIVAVMTFNIVGVAMAAPVDADVESEYAISRVTTAGESYTVRGLVVAKNTRAVVLYDGTDGIMVYGSGILALVDVGDYIQITATASLYNNLLQLNYTSETEWQRLDASEAPEEKEAAELTPAVVTDWMTKAGATPSQLTVNDVQRYTWTASAAQIGNYWALTPSDITNAQIEPLYVDTTENPLQAGNEYDVVAYFIGANPASGTPYVGMMIQTLTPHQNQVEVVLSSEYLSEYFTAGDSVDLGITIANSDNQEYSVVSSDTAVAEWVSGSLVMRGVGATKLTITAAADETKTATMTLVVYDQYFENIGQITVGATGMIQGTVVAKTNNSVIIADSTGGIMVYDSNQVSSLVPGDIIYVVGTVTEYNGLAQFSYNPGVVITSYGEKGTVPTEATPLTEQMLVDWTTARAQKDVKLYSWRAVAGTLDGYNIYSLSENGVKIESAAELSDITLGTTYDFEGYFAGYNTTNAYASFVITKYTVSATQDNYLAFYRYSLNLGLDTTYQLNPIVGGTIDASKLVYSGYNEDVVTVSASGLITAKDAGETVITVTGTPSSGDPIVRQISVKVDSSISQVTEPNTYYSVIGKIVAKTSQSVVIHDGTAGILVFSRTAASTYDIDDVIQVSGTVSTFNHMLQFSGSLDIRLREDITIDVPALTPLTKDIADSWVVSEGVIPVTECKGYTWEATAVVTDDGFMTINIEGSDTIIEPVYLIDSSLIEDGKTYTITGYFIGYSSNNSYAAIAVVDAVLVG